MALASLFRRDLPFHAIVALAWALILVCGQSAPAKGYGHHPQVQLVAVGDVLTPPTQTFVITHGCGGTAAGDRFHRLASLLKRSYPNANVFRLDWSAETRDEFMGFPNPWTIARKIDATGKTAAQLLQQLTVDASSLILIGESFGVYVNHRIAERLGKIARVLAFNPASEMGGYLPPILQNDAARLCVFTTTSVLDCQLFLAPHALRLATDDNMNLLDKHTFGIVWLCCQLEAGDRTWLNLDRDFPIADADHLSGVVQPNGILDAAPILRLPAAPGLTASVKSNELQLVPTLQESD